MTTLALDIGGTKLAAALIDSQRRIIEKQTTPTPSSKTQEALTEALSALVTPFAGRMQRVSLASTGIIRHGVLTALNPDNLGGLAQFPLVDTLINLTGLPCLAINDAQAAAWAEYKALPAGVKDMVFITVSTGVGGGIISNGMLLSGAGGLAGHIGHTLADPHGPRCGCGRTGCVEAIASGKGIAALASGDLRGMAAKEIFALAQSGHRQATALVRQSAQTIARLIMDMKASYDCQYAVLGGSIGLAPGYIALVEEYLRQAPAVYHTKIITAYHRHDAGLLGAALLAEEYAL